MPKDDDDRVDRSTGNVFADLDLPDPDEALAKAELVHRIGGIIAERGLTPAAAASLLGVEGPELSGLLRGRFEDVPIGRLFRFLNALGSNVEIIVRPGPRSGGAETRVVTA